MNLRATLPVHTALVAACALVVFPLLMVLIEVAGHPSLLGILVTDPRVRGAAWLGLQVALGAAAVAVGFAAPLAVLCERTDLPGARLLSVACRVPLALPSYLLAMAWLRLWSPRSGLMDALGMPLDLLTPWGCAVILGVAELPVVMLPLQAALRRVDPSLEEAARICGASPARALWDASLRPSLPALATGAALATASALAAFGVPLLLGTSGTTPFSVLTTVIYEQILVGTGEARARASVLAVGLAALSSTATLLAFVASRAVARGAQGKPQRPRVLHLGPLRIPAAILAWGTVVVVLVAPLVALVVASLLPHAGAHAGELTLEAHRQLLTRRGLLAAVARSGGLAIGAAFLSVLVAVVVSAWADRRGDRVASVTASLVAWPYVLPGSVLALGLLAAWARPIRIIVLDTVTITILVSGTSWMLLMAYALKHAALAVRPLRVALRGVGTTLDEAARIAGARPLKAFMDGTLPTLRPAMVSAAITVALLCFSELTMSVMLVGADTEVVGTVLFELHSYASPAESAALATWMTLVALVGFGLAARQDGAA